MNAAELRDKSVEELNTQLLDLLREQFNFRMQKTTGQLKQTHVLEADQAGNCPYQVGAD